MLSIPLLLSSNYSLKPRVWNPLSEQCVSVSFSIKSLHSAVHGQESCALDRLPGRTLVTQARQALKVTF
jgi:hypothetical protein